jgi:hypothetical protein
MSYYLKTNEMKQTLRFFVGIAAVAAGMFACSSEEIVPDVQPVIERSNLTVILNNNEAATKAVTDANAVSKETAVSSISLFVFGAATKAEADTIFNSTGSNPFTEGNDNEYKATFLNAPVGSKNVYVGVNLPQSLHSYIRDNGVAAVYTLSLAEQKAILYPATGGFPMFSDGSVTPLLTIKSGETNVLNVSVKRFVSKVTLETSAAFEANAGSERTVNGVTVDAALTFAMGQVNTKFFPYPQKVDGEYLDPNYFAVINGSALGYQADFTDEFYDFKGNHPNWTSTVPANVFENFKAASASADAPSIDKFNPGYVLENTNEQKLKGELTYASVKAKFTPGYTHSYDASKKVTATANSANKNDYAKLYVFNNGGTYYYFTDEAEAKSYGADTGLGYSVYVDCYCFYNVFLNPAKGYDVLRNDYYQVVVNKVSRLGNAYSGVDDPTVEQGGVADLQVTVTVQSWSKVRQETILGDKD